jgi:hypothetical protein
MPVQAATGRVRANNIPETIITTDSWFLIF